MSWLLFRDESGHDHNELQYRGRGQRDGRTYDSHGLTYVPNPYGGTLAPARSATFCGFSSPINRFIGASEAWR